jgi:hypothetical protein
VSWGGGLNEYQIARTDGAKRAAAQLCVLCVLENVMARISTKYQPLNLNPAIDFDNSRPLHNADLLLRDAHAMLFLPRKDIADLKSGCNFAMLITLCSILGGLSRTIYPRNVPNKDTDKECFLALFKRMPWGNEQNGWIPRDTAAGLLYDGFRSPRVHELGTDELTVRSN